MGVTYFRVPIDAKYESRIICPKCGSILRCTQKRQQQFIDFHAPIPKKCPICGGAISGSKCPAGPNYSLSVVEATEWPKPKPEPETPLREEIEEIIEAAPPIVLKPVTPSPVKPLVLEEKPVTSVIVSPLPATLEKVKSPLSKWLWISGAIGATIVIYLIARKK